MKITKKTFVFLSSLLLLVVLLSSCSTAPSAPTVESIEISQLPTKTEYKIGETFSATGGELTATMSDKTTQIVPLTDENVVLSSVNTEGAGNKSVTVTCGEARTRFSVMVAPITVSFDLGEAEGVSIAPIELRSAGSVADKMPADPSAEGMTFAGWFSDANYTSAFDPTAEITADMTVYAQWLSAEATYYTVTFDANYYGSHAESQQQVLVGTSASEPAAVKRNGYAFDGWYTEAEGGEAYTYPAVTSDTTVYAHWTLTAEGEQTWVFEAELIDFTGKQGLAYSGATSEKGMIQADASGTASGALYVGYNYAQGITHDFHIVSDREVSDATVQVRLSAEFAAVFLTCDSFTVEINGEKQNFNTIILNNIPETAGDIRPFEDFVVAVDATLHQGANLISLQITNNDPPTTEDGSPLGTMRASAPLIDCVKVTTTAVLDWDGNYDMPGPLPR